ncbi:MAG TPA: hypothetical protein VFJ58_01090 [Armatimonadota bacterium]|nr:hypothetical protein [Armatimonadota bacterium]
MHPDLSTLYQLQLADTHLQLSRRQIQSLDWGDTQKKAIAALRSDAMAAAAEKNNTEKALREIETTLADVEKRIKRSEGRVQHGDIHNEHELESTEKELAALKSQRAELEDQALTIMEKLERFPARAEALLSREQMLLREREAVRERSTTEKARLEKDIEEVSARRDALASRLPAPLLQRYDQMRNHSSGVAIARIVNGACDACRVVVNPASVRETLETTALVTCQGCGRILYTEQE